MDMLHGAGGGGGGWVFCCCEGAKCGCCALYEKWEEVISKKDTNSNIQSHPTLPNLGPPLFLAPVRRERGTMYIWSAQIYI